MCCPTRLRSRRDVWHITENLARRMITTHHRAQLIVMRAAGAGLTMCGRNALRFSESDGSRGSDALLNLFAREAKNGRTSMAGGLPAAQMAKL
jgi:hypothetical protein